MEDSWEGRIRGRSPLSLGIWLHKFKKYVQNWMQCWLSEYQNRSATGKTASQIPVFRGGEACPLTPQQFQLRNSLTKLVLNSNTFQRQILYPTRKSAHTNLAKLYACIQLWQEKWNSTKMLKEAKLIKNQNRNGKELPYLFRFCRTIM